MNTEDNLTEAMRNRASEVTGRPDMGDVVSRARRIQRRRRTTAAVAAAVAVAAIAVPSALLLSGGPDASPAPVDHTPTPTPTQVPSKTPTTSPTNAQADRGPANAVARVALGKATDHAYLENGTIHFGNGSTSLAGRVAAFTAYHGGWLVADAESGQVQWIDGQGTVQRHGAGTAHFAANADGQTGYTMGGKVYSGISSGMSDQEDSAPVDQTLGAAIGYLSGGRLLYTTGPSAYDVLGGAAVGHRLDAIDTATAATDQGDLVAGVDAKGNGLVVSAATGRTLWSKEGWDPEGFSPDGKYVAATRSAKGVDFSEIAILDARTGDPVSHRDLPGSGISLLGVPVFEDDTHVLYVGQQQAGRASAVLRLDTSGHLDRATEIASSGADETPFLLSTGP